MIRKIAFIIIAVLMASCAVPTSDIATKQIQHQNDNKQERLVMIGALSNGVGVSLDRKDIPNAQLLNTKIADVAEAPTEEEKQAVLDSLDNSDAMKSLQKRLDELIQEKRQLEAENINVISTLSAQNTELQKKQQDAEDALAKFDNPWYSIKNGLLIYAKRIAWSIGIFAIIFFVLRTFAASNPIIGALFSVMSHFVAAIVKGMASIFPQLISHIGAVKQDVADARNVVLTKLVDEIDCLKEEDSIKMLKERLSSSMDTADKSIVRNIQTRK